MAAPEIAAVTTLHDGWTKVLKLTLALPDGEKVEREVEDHGAAVAVLPYDPQRRTAILVGQFRPAVLHSGGDDRLLEAVAGMLDESDPEACARREAHEEAGLRLDAVDRVGVVWSSPGVSTERIHLYLASYGPNDRVSDGGGLAEEHEDVAVIELPLDELWRRAAGGEIADLKTLVLIQALKLRRPELFTA